MQPSTQLLPALIGNRTLSLLYTARDCMATLLQRLDVELHTFTDLFANLIKASRVGKAESSKSQARRHE